MKFKTHFIALMAIVFIGQTTFAQQENPNKETPEQKEKRMAWWREAKFGMFIHWGIYAQFGGVYRGHEQKVSNTEWLMNRMKVPVQEYKDTAKNFNPEKYNAEQWVKMAKDAGMKYIVITAKHHDGFALFDSKVSNWDITDATIYKKDLIKPLADACRKYGLKFGIYYSQEQDWGNPGGMTHRRLMNQGWANPDADKIDAYTLAHQGSWDPAQQTKTFQDYYDNVALPQIKELLTKYGDISVLFWDTPSAISAEQVKRTNALVKSLQPNIISNDRLGAGDKGDYKTPEQRIPNLAELDGKDWETNMTMNNTWGYRTSDHNWKSSEELIRKLADITSKGGNFLLNIGPKPDGTFPQESVTRLHEVGQWMKKYDVAVYGTHANPIADVNWGRITAKDDKNSTTLYLSVFDWPSNGKLNIEGLSRKAVSAGLVGEKGDLKLLQEADGTLQISGLPSSAPNKVASVIAVKLNGLEKKKIFEPAKKMETGSID